MKEVMWVRDENGDRVKLDEAKNPVKMVYSVTTAMSSFCVKWEEVR
jgi:hypothetical protein